jgi:hypothetical protein
MADLRTRKSFCGTRDKIYEAKTWNVNKLTVIINDGYQQNIGVHIEKMKSHVYEK